jgi:hypothetical protein
VVYDDDDCSTVRNQTMSLHQPQRSTRASACVFSTYISKYLVGFVASDGYYTRVDAGWTANRAWSKAVAL